MGSGRGGDPLSVMGELEVARAALERRLEALKDGPVGPKDLTGICRACRLIQGLVEAERARKGRVSHDDLKQLVAIIQAEVQEPEARERIIGAWEELREP